MTKLNYKILWQQLARHLNNKKPFKHRDEVKLDQRFIAPAGDMSHDPKYGGWINPYEGRWGQGSARKKKSYEYY